MDRIADYVYRAKVLRQIMSNRAQTFRRVNGAQSLLTVVLTSFLGFVAFSGSEKVKTYVNWFFTADAIQVEFCVNLLVFFLFVLATLHMVFHVGKHQNDAERAIVDLTAFINRTEDLISREETGQVILNQDDLSRVRLDYESITRLLPANSDRDYVKAKGDIQTKEKRASRLTLTPQSLFDETQRTQTMLALIHRSAETMRILQTLRQVDSRLYLGGGVVRNLVWDYLHGFRHATPVDDVDVIYFDQLSATKDHDLQIEARLKGASQNTAWSVKNQARMHSANGDAPYADLKDAVGKWPETATAIAARLSQAGEVEIVVPHGTSDLFRLLVRPTHHFRANPQRVLDRASAKRWKATWPRIEVLVDPPAANIAAPP
jgi:uncharacterized protein